jgi:cytidylate kinase
MSLSPFRVVTVAREYGSGGAAVATRLAARLGYQLLDRALIARIADEAHIDPDLARRFDEHVDPWVKRIGHALWYGGFEAVAVVDENDVVNADRLAVLGGRVIEEGQCLLRGRPDVFHVFVYAPREERLRRLRERLGPGVELELVLEETDRERASYVRRHFGENWLDPRLYHLMVNAVLGEEAAVSAILAAVGADAPGPAARP